MNRCALKTLPLAAWLCGGCFAPVDERGDGASLPSTDQLVQDAGSTSVDGGPTRAPETLLYGVARTDCYRGVVSEVSIAMAARVLDCSVFGPNLRSATFLAILPGALTPQRSYRMGTNNSPPEGIIDRFGQFTDVATTGTLTVDSNNPWFLTGEMRVVFGNEQPTEARFLAVWCPEFGVCP